MKKIFLITTAVITFAAFFAGCKNSGGQSSSASSPQARITITVAGDDNVDFKPTARTFKISQGKKWSEIKNQAEALIKYKTGFEHNAWKKLNKDGVFLADNYVFTADTTVYAMSKQTTVPQPSKITITVAGDGNISHKTATRTVKVPQNAPWSSVKALAADIIKYADGYENDTWKLTDEFGQDIPDNYQFNADTTVYAVSKKKTITITVAGDENVVFKTSSQTFTAYYGDTWSTLKPQAEGKIKYKSSNYENKDWKLNDSAGDSLTGTYKFTADTAVFAESKLKDVTITINGDSRIIVTPPDTIKVPKGTKFGTVKAEIERKIVCPTDFKIKQWRKDNASGRVIYDHTPFGNDTTLYAEIKSVNITITIQGDNHIHVDPAHNTITRPSGETWKNIKNAVKGSVTCDPGYIVSIWKKGGASGINLEDVDKFEDDTVIYAVEQAVPVPENVSVTPPAGGIPGHAVSYTLPGTDNSWKGVFTAGRIVNLNPYKIGKHEVTVQLWNTVYKWAKENGYLFDFEEGSEDNPTEPDQPMANINWRDCIAWCNAYTEMRFGNTDECVYRKGGQSGPAIKDGAADGDKAYCDFSKKGYRLPTEAEWEFAARYRDNATNAEQYGTVYLTKVNSASGATKPIGFNGMTPSSDYETLCAETAKVAVFNKWWNGTAFVTQTPAAVTGRANVGSKRANKLGLYDMSGNVGEWCWDLYVDSITSSTEAYPTGPFPSHEPKRVVRGGYWSSGIENAVYFCMTGKRDNKGSSGADPIRGFRLVWKE